MKNFIKVPNETEKTAVIFTDHIVSIVNIESDASNARAMIFTTNNTIKTTLSYNEVLDLLN